MNTENEIETKDAQAYDLMILLEDDPQGEVTAECGCRLECTEWTVGFIFCDMHRQAPQLLLRAGYHDKSQVVLPPFELTL